MLQRLSKDMTESNNNENFSIVKSELDRKLRGQLLMIGSLFVVLSKICYSEMKFWYVLQYFSHITLL